MALKPCLKEYTAAVSFSLFVDEPVKLSRTADGAKHDYFINVSEKAFIWSTKIPFS